MLPTRANNPQPRDFSEFRVLLAHLVDHPRPYTAGGHLPQPEGGSEQYSS